MKTLELKIDRNGDLSFMPFGKSFSMPFGNYAIWEVTNQLKLAKTKALREKLRFDSRFCPKIEVLPPMVRPFHSAPMIWISFMFNCLAKLTFFIFFTVRDIGDFSTFKSFLNYFQEDPINNTLY